VGNQAQRCLWPGRKARPDVDLKCRFSWMPSIAPIMIIQMKRKRAISSVQM